MRASLTLLVASLCTAPLTAQQGDRGVFDIQRGETALGREEFSVQAGAAGSPSGTTIASLARYPGTRPAVQIQAMLERTADGAVMALQFDTRQASGLSKVYGAALQDNLTIRQTTPAAESVREYPRAAGIVILDDSVFALYQVVVEKSTPAGARLPVLFPRTGRRGQLTATRSAPTTVELSGMVTGTLTVDAGGRLMRVLLSDGVSAIRQAR
jgi:hypothetical protein